MLEDDFVIYALNEALQTDVPFIINSVQLPTTLIQARS